MQNEIIEYMPSSKPYRVTAYRYSWSPSLLVGDYDYYWQANLISWWYRHLLGFGCNTWKKKCQGNDAL